MLRLPACAVALFAVALAHPGRAAATTCSLAYTPTKVTYWSKTNPTAGSTRCDWKGTTPTCEWNGWLWQDAAKKASTGNLPLVVVVHGSGDTHTRSNFCEQVNRLVQKGYVVFMPYMRGVTDTSTASECTMGNPLYPDCLGGWRSTGTYIEDWVATKSDGSSDSDAAYTLSYMLWEAQDEVQFAITKMTALTSGDGTKPLIDPTKIAIMGHSYGGLVVTIAASQSLSPLPAATLDLSGGVLSWGGSPIWGLTVIGYAAAHQMPLYLQQTMNESPDGIVDSTLVPFLAANGSATGAEMAVWSNAIMASDYQALCDAASPPEDSAHCHHGFFLQYPSEVDRWWAAAFDFLTRHGVK